MVDKYVVGQIVLSKSGRDKGRPFIIIGVDDDFVYIADGMLRKIESPKRKKMKHVQPTNQIAEKILLGEPLTNVNLKDAIKIYLNKTSK
ncbi:MAG: hypothetical protein ATN33_02595 [Epulopiscium sp. Nele67-Bin001]|nr:MAG: hypothetical protein BEN18_08860 [Epulopiscium sp. Nuni2H_MBin001]OON90630.1 MAG: hypothetical protein ATN33_02595 [Epulopiscium sp. Nele67-Bin001]